MRQYKMRGSAAYLVQNARDVSEVISIYNHAYTLMCACVRITAALTGLDLRRIRLAPVFSELFSKTKNSQAFFSGKIVTLLFTQPIPQNTLKS